MSRLAFALLSLTVGACAFQLDRSLEAGEVSGTTLTTALPLAALREALMRRRPDGQLLHHSDRGCQYMSTNTGRLSPNKASP